MIALVLAGCGPIEPEIQIWESPFSPECDAVVVESSPVGDGAFTRRIRYEVEGEDASTAVGRLYAVEADSRTEVPAEQTFDPSRPYEFTLVPDADLSPQTTYEVDIELCEGLGRHAFAFRSNDVGTPVGDLTALDGTDWLLDLGTGEALAGFRSPRHAPVLSVQVANADAVAFTMRFYDLELDDWVADYCPIGLPVNWTSPWLDSSVMGASPRPLVGENQYLEIRCGVGSAPVRLATCAVGGLVPLSEGGTCDGTDCVTCPWSPEDVDVTCRVYDYAEVPAVPFSTPPDWVHEEYGCEPG